jgi:hypothetical protein
MTKTLTAARLVRVIVRYRRRKDQRALHCQLDDGNVQARFFDADSEADAIGYGDWSAARLIRLMRSMSSTQRIKAIRVSDELERQRLRMTVTVNPTRQPILTTDKNGGLFWL